MTEQARIRVLLVDDHRMFADAVAQLLQADGDVAVRSVASAEEAIVAAEEACPDVLLMDVDLGGTDGIEAIERIRARCPELAVIVITALRGPDLVVRAVRAGAAGFVPKTRAADGLLAAVRRAAAGELILPVDVLATLAGGSGTPRPRSEAERSLAELTTREVDVLQALAHGLSTDEIAERLDIATATVHSHVKNVLAKLRVRSKLEAVLLALRHDVVQLRPTDPG